MTLRHGDIVIMAALRDPRGQNPKDRPAVVVSLTEELRPQIDDILQRLADEHR